MVDQQLTEFVDRAKSAFGDQLVCTVLYGSAAIGDWVDSSSDLNVLCVLRQLRVQELGASGSIFQWWQEKGNPPPLLLSLAEVQTASDCFPMEYHDMQAHRRVLQGEDVIANLHVDHVYYRAQVEHELRSKQIRLRQKATELLSKPEALIRLMTDSISTFCVLGRHALVLGGREARWKKREVIDELGKVANSSFSGFTSVLGIRADRKIPPETNAVLLFEKYLADIDVLVRFVDQIER